MNNSLLSNASSWIPLDEPNGGKKKPAMYQTYQRITQEDINKYDTSNVSAFKPDSQTSENQERVQRIESILQKMNQVNDSSTELANYSPPALSIQDLSVPSLKEPLFDVAQTEGYQKDGQNLISSSNEGFSSSYGQGSSYGQTGSSYQRVYNTPVPYFEPPLPPIENSKLMEKLNYMIHLLEEQQHENTKYIWEEFLLYGLLGVFMIYLVDSFARAGKYIR